MQLTGYIWETSDSLSPGNAILVLPKGMSATSVSVGSEKFNKLSKKYKEMEVWYGSKKSELYVNQTIKVSISAEYTANTGGTATTDTGGTSSTTKSETSKNPVYANNNRAHFRFSKPGSSYGSSVKVYLDSVLVATISNGSSRYEGSNGFLWKPVSENDGKLVILGLYNVKYSTCTIKYN